MEIQAEMLPVAAVKVGERGRKNLGDVEDLAKSIDEVGLLHPIVVDPEYRLIAGARRLAAFVRREQTEIPVYIVSHLTEALDLLLAEIQENTCRKPLDPEEAWNDAQKLEGLFKPAAEAAEKAGKSADGKAGGRGRKKPCADSAQGLGEPKTRQKVAAAVGYSHDTLSKIGEVVEAAKAAPKEFAKACEKMNRTGNVNGAHRAVKRAKDEQKVLAVPVVTGRFRTIVIDPPWDHEGLSLAGRGAPEYAVMGQEQLLALTVGEWAEEECHLYLWTTNNFILRAGELMAAWGFDFKTVLTWVKPRIGMGSYFRSSTEHVLFGIRGKRSTRVDDIPTHFEAPVGKHSAKPDSFFALVERASYPPYLEAFARKERPNWQSWGSGTNAQL